MRELDQSTNCEKCSTVQGLKGVEVVGLSIPAGDVGGDFFDFVPMGEKSIGLIIADVSGNGPSIAPFMVFFRDLIRKEIEEARKGSNAIKKANSFIWNEDSLGLFVTLFYAILDLDRKTLKYINAGHCPPVLLRAQSGNVTSLGATGIPLGMDVDAEYQIKKVQLMKGDIVAIYTDGLTESHNERGEPFGEGRLVDIIKGNSLLSAHNLIHKIYKEVASFTNSKELNDDVTLVVFRQLQ